MKTIIAASLKEGQIFQHNQLFPWMVLKVEDVPSNIHLHNCMIRITAKNIKSEKEKVFDFGRGVKLNLK